MKPPKRSGGSWLNLGPVSTKRLNEIGVLSREDLERVGSAAAYIQLKRLYPREISLNLLYGMEACILDIHWTKLPKDVKARLKDEVTFVR